MNAEAAPDPGRARRRALRHAAFVAACIAAIGIITYYGWLSIIAEVDPNGGNELVLTWTGRIAALYLLLAFSASALAREKMRLGRILVRARRTLGLCFAALMSVHLIAILLHFNLYNHEPLPLVILLLGGLGYSFVFLMAATSNDLSQRLMGHWWGRLHRVGIIYLWFVLLAIYTYEALEDGHLLMIGYLLLVLASGYLRVRNTLSRALSRA